MKKECYECRTKSKLKRMDNIFWICDDCIDGHNYYQCGVCEDYHNDNDTQIVDDKIICDYCN